MGEGPRTTKAFKIALLRILSRDMPRISEAGWGDSPRPHCTELPRDCSPSSGHSGPSQGTTGPSKSSWKHGAWAMWCWFCRSEACKSYRIMKHCIEVWIKVWRTRLKFVARSPNGPTLRGAVKSQSGALRQLEKEATCNACQVKLQETCTQGSHWYQHCIPREQPREWRPTEPQRCGNLCPSS